MKSIIGNLDKSFENRIRLGIMSVLIVSDWVDFSMFKQLLEVTDGNLASHLNALEKKKYIEFKKEFVGRKPKTSFKITKNGEKSFKAHLAAMEQLVRTKPWK